MKHQQNERTNNHIKSNQIKYLNQITSKFASSKSHSIQSSSQGVNYSFSFEGRTGFGILGIFLGFSLECTRFFDILSPLASSHKIWELIWFGGTSSRTVPANRVGLERKSAGALGGAVRFKIFHF